MKAISYRNGQKLGECIFIRDIKERTSFGRRQAIFTCKCGLTFQGNIDFVKRGHTTSCGCSIGISEKHRKLRFNNKDEYRAWVGLRDRCYNNKISSYKYYGKRGIKVCKRWLGKNGFKNFLADMGKRPSKNHSVDRFPNNNGIYTPSNCRWATSLQQQRNKRINVFITFRGKRKCISEWAMQFNLPYNTLWNRIKAGLPIKSALTNKPNTRRWKKKPVNI